jgi:hypothetical protein
MSKISKFFTLDEMCRSSTAIKAKIDNTPNQEVIDNLTMLCNELLDEIREEFGPTTVNSGYRSKALNLAVKGSKTSDHLIGCAADITIPGHKCIDVARWIIDSPLTYNQIILEGFDRKTGDGVWLHISLKPSGNKKQVLTMMRSNGKTVYTDGLPV